MIQTNGAGSTLIAIKRPGEALSLSNLPDDAEAAREAIIEMLGDIPAYALLRRSHHRKPGLEMILGDNCLNRDLPANFAYPGHPGLFVKGVAIFAASIQRWDQETFLWDSVYVDLSDDHIALIKILVA